MSSLIQMQAVVEAPYYQGDFLCPWDVPQFESFSWIRLSGDVTYQDIGLVFAQLAQYNQIKLVGETQEVLQQVLEAESLVLPGGIQVIYEVNKSIAPSCCCGLETWREWVDFLTTGQSPWLGHDPSPWLEMQGDLVRIWSDGGLQSINNAFYVDVSRTHFQKALRLVEQDLQDFLFCIDSWVQDAGCQLSSDLSQKFNKCFKIGGR